MDVLRGIAILLVIGAHLQMPSPGEGLVGSVARFWHRFGGFGVPLFFVLSGFLIGGLLLSELQKRGRISVSRFLVRRGLKIYPPYFAFLAYLFLMPLAKAAWAGGNPKAIAADWCVRYWPNLLFLQNYIGPDPAAHTWSLAVEEHFYLVLPFVLLGLLSSKSQRWILPIGLASTLIFTVVRLVCAKIGDPYLHDMNRTMAATHLNIDGLLLGVGLRALLEFEPAAFARLRDWRLPLLVGAVLLLWFYPASTVWKVPLNRIIPVNFWAAAALFVCAYHTKASDFGWMADCVRCAAIAIGWIGVYSYSIYLWHVTALGIIGKAVGGMAWETVIPIVWVMTAMLTCCGVAIVGFVASRMVEWPVLHLRDRFFPSRS